MNNNNINNNNINNNNINSNINNNINNSSDNNRTKNSNNKNSNNKNKKNNKKISFKTKIKNLIFLTKTSFKILKKDKEINTPIIFMMNLNILIVLFLFLSGYSFYIMNNPQTGNFFLFTNIFFIIPFSFLFNALQKSNISYIAYNTIKGVEINYNDAKKETKKVRKQLGIVALINIIFYFAKSKNNKRNSSNVFFSLIAFIFLSIFKEAWDLVQHFIIPVIIIEKKKFKDAINNIKLLKNNISESLMGAMGFDFLGGFFVFFIGLMIFVFLLFIASSTSLFNNYITILKDIDIEKIYLPFMIIYSVLIFIGINLKTFIDSIKIIYFTILYTSIIRPTEITPEIRNDLNSYFLITKDNENINNINNNINDNINNINNNINDNINYNNFNNIDNYSNNNNKLTNNQRIEKNNNIEKNITKIDKKNIINKENKTNKEIKQNNNKKQNNETNNIKKNKNPFNHELLDYVRRYQKKGYTDQIIEDFFVAKGYDRFKVQEAINKKR